MLNESETYIKSSDKKNCRDGITNEPGYVPPSGSNSTVIWHFYMDHEKVDVSYYGQRSGLSFMEGLMRIKGAVVTVLRVLHIMP